MQKLISIRPRGWSRRTRSMLQYSFFLFFFFFDIIYSHTGRTARQIWSNESSKYLVSCKNVPFGV